MSSNLTSDEVKQLVLVFAEEFYNARDLTKKVVALPHADKNNLKTGDKVEAHYLCAYRCIKTISTPDGNISGKDLSGGLTDKVNGMVQGNLTVLPFLKLDEEVEMNKLGKLLKPIAISLVNNLEADYARFMMENSGHQAGTYGTPVKTLYEVAKAGAIMESFEIPQKEDWFYVVNPFTLNKLADDLRSPDASGSEDERLSKALRERFSLDMQLTEAATLADLTTADTGGNRVGVLAATPDGTYRTAQYTMQQTLAVSDFGTFSGTVPAGTVVKVAGRNRLNPITGQPILDEAMKVIEHTGVVASDAVLTDGAGDLIVSGPALHETDGTYNTVDSPLTAGDKISMLGEDAKSYQPNLFWQKQAFAIGSAPTKGSLKINCLHTTKDGLQFQVSADPDTREVRFDFRPVYYVIDPFFAGQGWG